MGIRVALTAALQQGRQEPSSEYLLLMQSRKILRQFNLIASQGHPRSSILVPIESEYATTYYYSLIR